MPSTCPQCRARLEGAPPPPACPACGATTGIEGAVLFVEHADGRREELPFRDDLTLGRHPANTLPLADAAVSKQHAAVRRSAGGWWLQDLRSVNGTFLNGRRVDHARLGDGDTIGIGGTRLVFRLPRPAARITLVPAAAPQVLAREPAEPASGGGFKPESQIVDVEVLRRDYEKLRIANDLQRQIGLEPDLAALYEKILGFAFDLLRADNGVVLLYDARTGQARPEAVRRRREGGELHLPQTLLDRVVRSGEGLLTQDAALDERFAGSTSIVAQNIRSAMAVPLLSKGELRGVLYLDTREVAGAFTDKDLRLLAGVAAQAAVAIENAELARRIEQEAEARAHLSRFLSPALVEQAQAGRLDLKKGGQLCEVTVLFADIRGFTAMAERSEAQEIVALLNEHFELMVDEVFAQDGVLDKFIGDCLMALWGAPVRRDDDPSRAVRAAIGMQQRLREFNAERAKQSRPALEMGIGISTGQAVVGNMGSSKRLEYTAIGDPVNLAARLCDAARAGQIVVSAATLGRGDEEFDVVALPPARVKGKQAVVPVFQVFGYARGEP